MQKNRYAYYPGCSLKRYGTPFETSALACAAALGIDMPEMGKWNCCGTVHGLSRDRLIYKVAPLRNILRAREQGFDGIVTLCSICFNTLRRTNDAMKAGGTDRTRLNNFLDEYGPYDGSFPVKHLLEVIRDDVGFDSLAAAVKNPLAGLAASPYYGCMLVRPASLGLDDMERPRVLSDLIEAIGAKAIESPYATECCGSYHAVNEDDTAAEYASRIIGAASARGAELIVSSCPLCVYNLDYRQAAARRKYPALKAVPVLYFTQVLGLALGVPESDLGLDSMTVDSRFALAGHSAPSAR